MSYIWGNELILWSTFGDGYKQTSWSTTLLEGRLNFPMYLSLVPSFQEHILEIVNYLHLSDNHETVPNTDFRN